MSACLRCGRALPAPSSVFDRYSPRGLLWLVIVVMTVGVMAIGLALETVVSLSESEMAYSWRLLLTLSFASIMVLMSILSVVRASGARMLARYCPNCAAILATQRLSRPEELGAHKVKMKKE